MPHQDDPNHISLFPPILDLGDGWRGYECLNGFYMIYYEGEDSKSRKITETGSEQTFTLKLPFVHRLIRFEYLKDDAVKSHSVEVRYTAPNIDKNYYAQLYTNTALTAKSSIREFTDSYENLAGATIELVVTGSGGGEKYIPIFYIKFFGDIE